jgi:hypothetical protein
MFAGIAICGYSNYGMNIKLNSHKKLLQNIYNIYMFAGIAIYGYSNHGTDITLESASKNCYRTYLTLRHLQALPYMVTLITKWTSLLNLHQKTVPEHI